jgi:hypothetical protein
MGYSPLKGLSEAHLRTIFGFVHFCLMTVYCSRILDLTINSLFLRGLRLRIAPASVYRLNLDVMKMVGNYFDSVVLLGVDAV